MPLLQRKLSVLELQLLTEELQLSPEVTLGDFTFEHGYNVE